MSKRRCSAVHRMASVPAGDSRANPPTPRRARPTAPVRDRGNRIRAIVADRIDRLGDRGPWGFGRGANVQPSWPAPGRRSLGRCRTHRRRARRPPARCADHVPARLRSPCVRRPALGMWTHMSQRLRMGVGELEQGGRLAKRAAMTIHRLSDAAPPAGVDAVAISSRPARPDRARLTEQAHRPGLSASSAGSERWRLRRRGSASRRAP